MSITLDLFWTTIFVMVMISWFAFAFVFLLRKKPASAPDKKKDRASITGIVFQGASFSIVWSVHRPMFSPIVPGIGWLSAILGIIAVIASVSSVLLIMRAIKELGKEWSLTARMLEGHRLVTNGPYAYVRHPIYTGMLGMLVATGLAISYWPALLIAIAIFFAGTYIRVGSEEKLLRETFGQEFERYSRQVPAIIPSLYVVPMTHDKQRP
jgi:protein-S-isoprenylcysteine O-methyltransferase Ste14